MTAAEHTEPPAGTRAVCCACGRYTSAAVPVRYVERPSGPGLTLYACPDCAPKITPGQYRERDM